MYYKSRIVSKNLTNLTRKQVLKIIAESPNPLSSYQIHKEWMKRHSPGSPNRYIYQIVRDLFKPDGNKRHIQAMKGFLRISYKEKYEKEISRLRQRFGIGVGKKYSDYGNVRVIVYKNAKEEMDRTRAILKIGDMMRNIRYYRYSLNFKGFLLYLLSSYDDYEEIYDDKISEKRNNIRTVYQVIKILTTREDDIKDEFEFLRYFNVFDEIYGTKEFVRTLLDIANELRYQLEILTSEYIQYYFMRRCYEEVMIRITFINLNPFKSWLKQKDRDNIKNEHSKLELSRIQILNILIRLQKEQLKIMEEDLKQNI